MAQRLGHNQLSKHEWLLAGIQLFFWICCGLALASMSVKTVYEMTFLTINPAVLIGSCANIFFSSVRSV